MTVDRRRRDPLAPASRATGARPVPQIAGTTPRGPQTSRTPAAARQEPAEPAAPPPDGPDPRGVVDVAGLVRRVRRLADLSQRDLAAQVGVSPATIARAELDGRARVTVDTLIRILGLVGFRLVVEDGEGEPIPPSRTQEAHDNGGRHAPAHLDPYVAGPKGPWHFPMGYTTRKIPRICWHHRLTRDSMVARGRARPIDHLTDDEVDVRWAELEAARHAARLAARRRMEERSRAARAVVHPRTASAASTPGYAEPARA